MNILKNNTKIICDEESSGERLDIFLSKNIDHLTRSNIKKIIKKTNVKLNGKPIVSQSKKLKKKDVIEISFEEKSYETIKPSNKKVKIVYDDEDIIVVDKPQGMVVHPGAGNKFDTLVNILLGKYKNTLSNLNGEQRPGIVHRIDKDTSGLLVVAKNNLAHAELGKQFSDHSIKRKYFALIWGVLRPLNGKISTFIRRSKKNRQLMTNDELKGKKAITNYKTLKVFDKKNIPKISLIEFELETGRTHQIRVHMNYKKTSILGDQKYNKKNMTFKKIDKNFEDILKSFKGQALHASILGFRHPVSLKNLEFSSKLPLKFEKLLNFLENFKN